MTWTDTRLSQAYELIDAVAADQNQPTGSPISETLRRAREAVEAADSELIKLKCTSTHCERRQECASPSECTGDGKRLDPIIAAMSWIAEASDLLLSVDLDTRMKRQLAHPSAIIDGLRPYIGKGEG